MDIRANAPRARTALAVGGAIVVEATHRESLLAGNRIGEAILFGDNELLQLFPGLRVLHYEDVVAPSDFGDPVKRETARTVRLMAQRMPSTVPRPR